MLISGAFVTGHTIAGTASVTIPVGLSLPGESVNLSVAAAAHAADRTEHLPHLLPDPMNEFSEAHEDAEPIIQDQPFTIEVAERVRRLPPYLFAEINKLMYEKRRAGADVIDLGMGNPTDPPQDLVIEKLVEAAHDPKNHGYALPRASSAYGAKQPPNTCGTTAFASIRSGR